jgi:hypothetical protein
MKKNLIVILSLILIVVISGCVSQTPTITGGPGVVITDASIDYSPIFAGDTVGWNLEVQNQGESDTTIHRITWFGVDMDAWDLNPSTAIDITTRPSVVGADPITGFEGGTYFETRTITAPMDIKSPTTVNLGIRVEYSYDTDFSATIRIMDPDYLRTLSAEEKNTLIQSGGIRDSASTSGPLSVKAASGAHFVARGGGTREITIPFRITNVGPGLPYSTGVASAETAATDGGLYEVTVVDTSSNLDCSGVGNVVLSRGKNGGFGCVLTIPSTVVNYEDRTFSLTLRYNYYVDGSTSLTVNPEYGT